MRTIETIGVVGQKSNGKDEVTKRLLTHLPGWSRKGFAEPVKKIFSDYFDFTPEMIEEWKNIPHCPPNMDKTVRDSLIAIGDGFRKINPRVWTNYAFKNNQWKRRIFGDTRYENEVNTILRHSGINVFVYRPGWINNMENESESWSGDIARACQLHGIDGSPTAISEAFFPVVNKGITYVIRNDGSIEDLERKVDKMVGWMKESYRFLEPFSAKEFLEGVDWY